MSTVAVFDPLSMLPVDPPPLLSRDTQDRPFLGFDPATDEIVDFLFKAPSGIDVGGDQELRIKWRADTATTGNVVWSVQVEALSADDSVDTDAASSFAAAQTVTDAAPGTAGFQTEAIITLTVAQADSIAANDMVRVRISRDANNASDTMAGDAEILLAWWNDNG